MLERGLSGTTTMQALSRVCLSGMIAWIETGGDPLLPQGERKQRTTRGEGDILRAIDPVCHRSHGDVAARGEFPQQLAIAGIESREIALAGAGKQKVGGRGED